MSIPDKDKKECCVMSRGVDLTRFNNCWQEDVCLQDPNCAFEERLQANGEAVKNEYGVNVPWCYIKNTSTTGEVLFLLFVIILLAVLLFLERMKEGNNVLILLT